MQPETRESDLLHHEMDVLGAVAEAFAEDIQTQAASQWYQNRGWEILGVDWSDPPADKVRGEHWLSEPLWGEVRVRSPLGNVWEIVFTADPPEGGWTRDNYVPGQARPAELREPPSVDPDLDVPAILRTPPAP